MYVRPKLEYCVQAWNPVYSGDIYKMIGDGEPFSRVLEARTRGHNKKLLVPQSIINIRKHSFSVRNINVWNMLPEHIVIAETLNIFKSKIDVFLCESNVA